MSIKKRIVPVSFSCNPENREDLTYDLVYYPESDDGFNIKIHGKVKKDVEFLDSSIAYPMSLFVEIVDFLRKENFIDCHSIADASSLKKDGDIIHDTKEGSNKNALSLPNIHPISSFDDTEQNDDQQKNNEHLNITTQEESKEESKESPQEESKEDIKINRPLIKTRVDDEEKDPLKAERDAKMIRDKMLKNNKKVVKRKEEKEEE